MIFSFAAFKCHAFNKTFKVDDNCVSVFSCSIFFYYKFCLAVLKNFQFFLNEVGEFSLTTILDIKKSPYFHEGFFLGLMFVLVNR